MTAFCMSYIFLWMMEILKTYSSEGESIFLKQSKIREDEQSGKINLMLFQLILWILEVTEPKYWISTSKQFLIILITIKNNVTCNFPWCVECASNLNFVPFNLTFRLIFSLAFYGYESPPPPLPPTQLLKKDRPNMGIHNMAAENV